MGLLVRFLYVRFARRGHPLWSPWTLVIAAVVTLIVAVGRAGGVSPRATRRIAAGLPVQPS